MLSTFSSSLESANPLLPVNVSKGWASGICAGENVGSGKGGSWFWASSDMIVLGKLFISSFSFPVWCYIIH